MSDSLQPRELKSLRFLCPWDSLGKNTGVGCHALLQGESLEKDYSLEELIPKILVQENPSSCRSHLVYGF